MSGVPPHLRIDDGAWVRYRLVEGEGRRAVVTGEDGRFLLLDGAEIDAARGGDEEGAAVLRRLAELGFVCTAEPSARAEASAHHVVLVSCGTGSARRVMDAPTARAAIDCAFAGAPSHVRLDLRGIEPPVEVEVLRALVDSAVDRSRERGSELSVVASIGDQVDDATLRFLVGTNAALNADLETSGADRLRVVRRLHALYRERGIDPELAYVTAVATLTDDVLERGAKELVAACVSAGVVYLQVRLPAGAAAGLRAFHREVVAAVLETNLGGTLLVEKRLALHLEALTQRCAAGACAARVGSTRPMDACTPVSTARSRVTSVRWWGA